MKAEAQKVVAENEAKARKYTADAEGKAAAALASRREYEVKMRQLSVLSSLAANDRLVLTGHNGDNMVAQILAARDSSTSIGLHP
jgi:hypothetical protein